MAASPAARKAVQLSQEAPQGSSCCVAWFHIGTPLISSLQSSGFVHLIHRCLVEYGHRVHRLIVTCTSADACAHLRSELRAKGQVTVLHLSLGVDGATSMGLFLNQHRPQIGLILDTPALPNFVLLASAFGVRLCLLDTLQGSFRAERYWQAWASMRKLLNSVLDPPPSYLPLTEDARKNLNIAHGLTDPHSNACQPWRPTAEEALALKRGLGHQCPLWLAANILPGEEDIIGAAHLSLAPHHPGLCTVLLPDDASRCEEVSHILRSKYKLRVTLWPPKPGAHRAEEGGGDDGPEAWHDVLLVAEAALLPLLFSVCEVVLIGSGALENCSAIRCMAEAAAAGCALLLGPSAGPRAVHLAQQLNAATLDMAGVGEQMDGGWMGRQASSLLPLPPLHNEVPCGSVGGSSNGAEGQGRHLGGLGAEGDAPAGGCGQVGSNSGTEWGGNGGWHAFFRAPQYEQGLRSVIAGVRGASVNRPPPPQQEAPHSAAAVAPDPDSESSKAAPSIAASLNAASSNGTDRQTAGHLQLQPNPTVVAHQPSIKVPCTPPVVLVPPTPSLGTASQPIPSPATQQLGDASAHRKEPPALSQQSSPEQHPLQASSLLESTTDDLPSCSPIPINTPFLHHPPPAHLLTHSRNSSLSSFASSPPPSMLRAPFVRNPLASLSSWLTSESSTSTQGSAAPVHPLPPSVSQHAATGSMDSWGSGSSAGHTHKLPHHHPQNTTHPPGGGAQQGQARGPSRLAHTTSSSGIAADEAVGARQPASPPARGFKVGSTGSVFDSGYFLADGDGTPSRAGSYEGHQGEQRQQQDQQQKQQQQQQRQPSPSRQLPALENIRKSMEGGSSGGGAGQGSMPIEREASLQLGISSATDTLPSKSPTSNSNPSCSTDQAPPLHESPSTLTSLTPPLPSSLVGASDARGPPSPTLLRPPSRKEDSLSSGGSCSTTPTADDALPAFNASVQNLVGLPACQQQQHHGALAQTAPPHHNHHHHHHHCHHPQHHPQPQQQQQLQEQRQSSEPCNRGEHVSGSGAGCGGDATVELGSCSSSATSRHSQKQGCAGERQHPFGGPHRQQHQQQEEDGDLPAPDKEESFRFQQTSASRSNSAAAAAAAAAAFFGTHLRPTPGPSLSSITPPCPIDTTEIPSHNTQCQRITISGWHRHPELHQGMEEEKEAEERHPRASHESAALFGAHLRPIPGPPPASIAPLCPTDTHKIPSHHSQYQRITVAGWHRHPELLKGEEGEEEVEETRPPAPHESSCNGLGGMPQQQAQRQHEHAGAVHDAGMLLAAACEQPARWGSHQQHQGHQQGLQPCGADDRGCKSVPSAGWGEADADGRIRAWQSHVQSLCVDNAAEHGSRGEVVLVEGGARETACGEWVRSVKGGDQGREQGGDLSTKQVALLQQAVGGPGVDGSVSCSSSGSGRQPRGLSSSCLSEATTAARTAVYAPHSAHGRDASTSSVESARPLSVQSGQGPNGTRIGFHPGPPATIPSSCSTAPPPSIVPPPGTASGSSSCSRRQSDQDVRNVRAADVSGMRVLAPLPHLHNVPRAPPAGQGDAHGAAVAFCSFLGMAVHGSSREAIFDRPCPFSTHTQAVRAQSANSRAASTCDGDSDNVGGSRGGMDASAAAAVASVSAAKELFTPSSKSCSPEPSALAAPRRTAKTSTSASNLQPATYPRRRHHPTRSCTSPLGAAAAVGPDAASRSCPVGTIAAPSTPRAAVPVSPRLGTLLAGITTSAASSPRPPLPLPPHAPAPPASPFHNTAHAAAPLHSTFPPAAGLAGVAGPLPAAAAFAAVPTEESNSALDAAAWRASGFEPQGQASPPCTPTSRMSALGAASSPFANPTFDRPCPFKTSRTGSMHTSPIDPAKRTGGPTTPRTHPPSPSLSRGGGQDISKWSPAQAPPPVPTDSPHSSSNSCGPWTVMTCPARPSACGGPHGEHGAASWGHQGKENGGWGPTPCEGLSRSTSHAREASNATDAANALADLGNNMYGGSGLGGGGAAAAAGGGSIKTCPSSQSQTLLHRYASSNRHHQEHLAASCLPTPSLLPLPLPAAQQQQPPHDPPSNNRPLFTTVPDALNPVAASAQLKPTAPSADVLQLCTQGQPGCVSPVMPPWILGMSMLAPPPLAPAYEGNAVLLPHEVTGLPCLPPPSAAGSCGVPQSPRRMDGKAPDLGSSSTMFFCADNPMHGPTTPHSFCSSACMAPLTSSSSGTPDYAAAPQNLVPHCTLASASTMRRPAHQPTSSGCGPSQNCSSSVLGGNTPHEQQRQQQQQQQQQQQVEVEVADRSAAVAGEESAKGSPSGTAESAKGSPGVTADRSTEVEKANSCGQLHFSQYQRGQQEQACPGQGQQPYGGLELHQQELEEEPAAPAYEEEQRQQHQGLELHPQPHQPQCSSAKMATLARNAAKRARTLAESALRSSLATTTALAASTATASSPHSSAARRLHQSISQGHVTRAAATRCAQLTALATEMDTLAVGLEAAAHAAKDAHTSAVSALQALPAGISGVGHGGGGGPTEVGPCKGGGRRHSCSSAFSRSLHGGDLVPPAGMHEGGASERQVGRLVGRQVGSPIVPACARRSLDSSSRPLSRYSNPAAAMLRMKEEHSFKGSRRHSSSSSSALSRSQDAGDQVHDGEASGRRRSCSSALSRSLHAGDLAPPAGVRDGKASGGPSVPPCARRSLDSCRPPSRSSNLAAAMLRMKEEHSFKGSRRHSSSSSSALSRSQDAGDQVHDGEASGRRRSCSSALSRSLHAGDLAPPAGLPQPTSVLAPPSMRSPYRRLFESQPNSAKKEGNGSSGGALAPAQHHASDSHAQATPASDFNAQATPTADSHAQATPASDSHIQAKAAAAPLSPSCSQPISFVAPTAGPGAPTNASPVDHSLPPASGSLTLPLPPIIPPLEPSCPSCEDRRDPCKSNGSRAGSPPRLSAKSSTSSDDPSAPLIHTYSRDPSCVALQALIPEAATAAAAVSSAAAASAAAAAAACPPPPTMIVAQEVIPRSRSPQLLLTHAPPALEVRRF
ncbi:hypothetical protein DUNSADRAFT_13174 [Dunaliella salina]|uniref:Uncharacterized protein n=1 Tax=Dunaliella salina TaxID=3046 RepID=A0ABQ7G9Y1_DUNSA|nr:hypothetical protein DUNSADRAFT_13174 [Dunaliella salina]|eukprot:KAF5831413.1 hypothetical protein DUNSADRAFT_13174 [Dunaliella salina]